MVIKTDIKVGNFVGIMERISENESLNNL